MRKANRFKPEDIIGIQDILLEYILSSGWKDYKQFSRTLAQEILCLHPKTSEELLHLVQSMRHPFFRFNEVSQKEFVEGFPSEDILRRLAASPLSYTKTSGYELAEGFISGHLEVGYDKTRFVEERESILVKLGSIRSPHTKLSKAFEALLQKISESFQVPLHGTKEYSGIDLSKRVNGASVGFQLKTMNDDVSEDKIRAQTSKALDYKLDGFVWIYGRPPSKEVETSIQAAYHHFKRVNEEGKMYCGLIPPELLAELFLRYRINL